MAAAAIVEVVAVLAEFGLIVYFMFLFGATADGDDCNKQQQNGSDCTLRHRVKLIKGGNFYSNHPNKREKSSIPTFPAGCFVPRGDGRYCQRQMFHVIR